MYQSSHKNVWFKHTQGYLDFARPERRFGWFAKK